MIIIRFCSSVWVLAAWLSLVWSSPATGQRGVTAGQVETVEVNTTTGTVRGQRESITLKDENKTFEVDAFRGIPYAVPPVGKLRFVPPRYPHPIWSGVRNASSFGNSCTQAAANQSVLEGSGEDCLFLNVYSPNGTSWPAGGKLPVMVWIHGGSFVSGSSSDYDGRVLAALGDVVVVTINYRLGVLGFYALGNGIGENIGLEDQQAALRWVKDNVVSFGGDPELVTIFGQSAGAASVNLHLLRSNEAGWPLFRRAIAQSGSSLAGWAVQERSDVAKATMSLAKRLNCSYGAQVKLRCLQQLPLPVLLQAQSSVSSEWNKQYHQLAFTPFIDGVTVLDDPVTMLANGAFAPVELISGANRDEWSSTALSVLGRAALLPEPGLNRTSFNLLMDVLIGLGYWGFPKPAAGPCVKIIQEALQFSYTDWSSPRSDPVRLQKAIGAGSDFSFYCPLKEQAQYWSAATDVSGKPNAADGRKMFMYEFSHVDGRYPTWSGVPHSAEVIYTFGYPLIHDKIPKDPRFPGGAGQFYTFTDEDRDVSMAMIDLWTAFARNGDPNGATTNSTNITWSSYNSEAQPYIDISGDITLRNFMRNEQCQLLGGLVQRLHDGCCSTSPTSSTGSTPSTTTPTTGAPAPSQPTTSSSSSLERWKVSAIVLAAVLLSAAVAAFVFWRCRRCRAVRHEQSQRLLEEY